MDCGSLGGLGDTWTHLPTHMNLNYFRSKNKVIQMLMKGVVLWSMKCPILISY